MGGAETQCLQLSEYLLDKGLEVIILCDSPYENVAGNPADWTSVEVPKESIASVSKEVDFFSNYSARKFGRSTVVFLKQSNVSDYSHFFSHADIVHFHMMPKNWELSLGLIRQLGKKSTMRFVSSNNSGDAETLKKNIPFVELIKSTIGRLIALDDQIKRELVEVGFAEKIISIINNGVNTDVFSPREWDVFDAVKFVYLGRFVPKKNVDLILKAFKHFKIMGGQGSLKLIGDGILRQNLQELAISIGLSPEKILQKPVFSQDEKSRILREFNVLIYPTKGDATPNSLLEGMSSGLAPLVSCDPGFDFLDHGLNCLKSEPGSEEGLAANMMQLYINKAQLLDIKKQARQTVLDSFCHRRSGENYLKVFKEIFHES